jgi:AAA domain
MRAPASVHRHADRTEPARRIGQRIDFWLALAVARGVSFAGQHDTMPGVTAYLALEDERGLKDRHVAYRQVYGVGGAQLIFLPHPLQLDNQSSVDDLAKRLEALARVAKREVALVVIDTLALVIRKPLRLRGCCAINCGNGSALTTMWFVAP